ncbi:hypothetical protein FSP39_008359 [Pinctada imbricata]|uniref:Uncharacterized protein n=1 Tax=Pinctada imbricata TaxID=66713 RepID=A0AA89BVL6_PINIB|nr:hypothetical protein FSP39_008359 [Pinctada imbricata]
MDTVTSARSSLSRRQIYRQTIQVKLVITGNLGVGKTSLVEWLILKKLNRDRKAKGQAAKCRWSHEVILDNGIVSMNIWDTAGQERYRSLTGSYYRGAHGGMIVYDVSQPSSFDSVTLWYKDLKEYSSNSERVSAMLVGTTSTSRNREVPMERAVTLAEHIGIPYMEVNIDTGENVNEAFEKLTRLVVENLERFPHALSAKHSSTTIVKQTQKSKSSFCAC